jgi:hypothetical protein
MTSATAWRNRITGHGEEAPDQLLANPRNWRIHPKAQQDALAGVLDQVGWVQDVIVNQQTGHVVDGHARVAIAISRNETTVPVVYVDLSEDEEALILATLDPLSAMAATDREQLSELLAEISTGDAAVQAMLTELAAANGIETGEAPADDPGAQIDRADELRQKWGTERGQFWEIGRHRLLCGDATSAEDVTRLMGGERAELTLTDPPYNVGKQYGDATDDRRCDYLEFSRAWFERCPSSFVVLTPGAVNLAMWYRDIGPPTWLCSWRKSNQNSPSGLQGFCTWEPLLTYGRPARRVGCDSWDIPVAHDQEDGGNPVPKTLAAWRTFLDAFATDGALVYDAFIGSGTTIVAAEQTGRICYGMEIEPKYVAVTLERLAGMIPEGTDRIARVAV